MILFAMNRNHLMVGPIRNLAKISQFLPSLRGYYIRYKSVNGRTTELTISGLKFELKTLNISKNLYDRIR